MDTRIAVTELDHIVLDVADVERSLAFYVDQLGLAPLRVDEWRRGEILFPSVRINADTIIDLLAVEPHRREPQPLLPGDRADRPDALAASGRFDVVDGPDVRYGARGNAMSLYVRDPDANVVELRQYP